MVVLGIETSCDECAVSLVRDGKTILSSVVSTQIEHHSPFEGVVPELASRLHAQTIVPVYRQALSQAGLTPDAIDAIAVTSRPGLVGSLLVGLNFAKGLAFSLRRPWIGVDHILAHLYAPQLVSDVPYPFVGLLVSGGHSLITLVRDFDDVEVLGTTIDDAVGEAFDKVAKFYGLGYPGGRVIDEKAQAGDPRAFRFPKPHLHKGAHSFDVSYSGLKTAVTNQKEKFLNPEFEPTLENICAAFQKTAIDILIGKVKKAVKVTHVHRIVAGGGVAANSYLRSALRSNASLEVFYPPLWLCTDNAAMIAGIGYQYLKRGETSGWDLNAESRVARFKHRVPSSPR